MEGVELEGGGRQQSPPHDTGRGLSACGPSNWRYEEDAAEGFRPYLVKDFSGKFGLYGPIHKAICKNGDFLL